MGVPGPPALLLKHSPRNTLATRATHLELLPPAADFRITMCDNQQRLHARRPVCLEFVRARNRARRNILEIRKRGARGIERHTQLLD